MASYYTDDAGTRRVNGRGIKRGNYYAAQVENYDAIPKAVFAAIAVSALTCGGDWIEHANERIMNEWRVLYQNGIVPQRPPARMWIELED